jgi:carbonic anhydrase
LGGVLGSAATYAFRSPASKSVGIVRPPEAAFAAAEILPGVPGPQESLARLMAGNARFCSDHAEHPHCSLAWRASIVAQQHPYACILGCSDSRVAPEVIFDEGLGELFIVRQAGHVADDDTLGSLEYAVEHLHIPLIVVLGHQNCGAVQTAMAAVLQDQPAEGHMLRLVDDLTPAVQAAQAQPVGDLVDAVVRHNIQQVVQRLRHCGPIIKRHERLGDVRVVGAYYPLQSGAIEWLTD